MKKNLKMFEKNFGDIRKNVGKFLATFSEKIVKNHMEFFQ